jgi:hypothetical protein
MDPMLRCLLVVDSELTSLVVTIRLSLRVMVWTTFRIDAEASVVGGR